MFCEKYIEEEEKINDDDNKFSMLEEDLVCVCKHIQNTSFPKSKHVLRSWLATFVDVYVRIKGCDIDDDCDLVDAGGKRDNFRWRRVKSAAFVGTPLELRQLCDFFSSGLQLCTKIEKYNFGDLHRMKKDLAYARKIVKKHM